ncbi:MAG: cAMP-activated global transcriptional regulator CRP [Lysobacterales bacterium CG02_land_8_20_14_3_00_62_12]|nr:MAG: cAMP-activated global transcriptional regulator CRP [Xanthomonadales bacterium CG02_land_8_20_14_3_00_62_12]
MRVESGDRLTPLSEVVPKCITPKSLAFEGAALEHFLNACHRRRYPSRSAIFMAGDRADVLYYVIDGSLSIVADDDDGRELILAYINKGEFIGELGLYVESPRREVQLRTRSSTELAEISHERLLALFEGSLREDCPRILFAIGQQLTRRLLHTSRKVSRLAFLDVTGRISRTLLDLCGEPEALSHPRGTQIRVSRQELSRIVGCSREMAGRVLKQLEEQGKIAVAGKTIVVFGTR